MRGWKKTILGILVITILAAELGNRAYSAGLILAKYAIILGYELRNIEDTTYVREIMPGDELLVKVKLIDPRLTAQDYANARATLITNSFQSIKSDEMPEDVLIQRRGSILTLSFPVTYTGLGNIFSFTISYDGGGFALPADTVDIVFDQCQPAKLPDTDQPGESDMNDGDIDDGTAADTGAGTGEDGAGSASASSSEQSNIGSGYVPQNSHFFLTAVDYGEGPVTAGEDFLCTVTVMADQGDYSINDALLTLTLPAGFSFADGTDRIYLGTLKPGQAYDAVFSLRTDENLSQYEYMIKVNMSGVNGYGGLAQEAKGEIAIAVTPIERLEITGLTLPTQINSAYDDGSGWFQFQLTNTGHAKVTDIQVIIEGDSFKETEPYKIDQLSALESQSINLNLIAAEEGELAGQLRIAYQDAAGVQKELTTPIQVSAEYRKAELDHSIMINPEIIKEEPVVPDWIWAVAVVGALCSVMVLVKIVGRYLRKTFSNT